MKVLKTFIILLAAYVCFQIIWIVGGGMLEMAGLMVPSSKSTEEKINESMESCGDWFHEHSGRTDKQREESRNAAGIYYNKETGKWEEDPERYARDIERKFGKHD